MFDVSPLCMPPTASVANIPITGSWLEKVMNDGTICPSRGRGSSKCDRVISGFFASFDPCCCMVSGDGDLVGQEILRFSGLDFLCRFDDAFSSPAEAGDSVRFRGEISPTAWCLSWAFTWSLNEWPTLSRAWLSPISYHCSSSSCFRNLPPCRLTISTIEITIAAFSCLSFVSWYLWTLDRIRFRNILLPSWFQFFFPVVLWEESRWGRDHREKSNKGESIWAFFLCKHNKHTSPTADIKRSGLITVTQRHWLHGRCNELTRREHHDYERWDWFTVGSVASLWSWLSSEEVDGDTSMFCIEMISKGKHSKAPRDQQSVLLEVAASAVTVCVLSSLTRASCGLDFGQVFERRTRASSFT